MKSSPTSVSGFTLIELLLVVSIGAILTMIALPSFRSMTQSQQVKNASYDLYAALSFTRSEAIKRNSAVTIAPVSTNWGSGWTVTSGTTVLKKQSPFNKVSITPGGAGGLTYQASGRSSSATFYIDASGVTTPTPYATCIKIELSGMPRMSQPVNGACP